MSNRATLQNAFCEYLHDEFQRRRTHNPSYSLRAFSRSLGVNDSTLSQILRFQRNLTQKTMERLAASLGVSLNDIHETSSKQKPIVHLETEKAKALSHWYYDAILELVQTNPQKFTSQTIAKELDIHPLEALQAIKTLRHLGFLSQEKDDGPKNLLGSSTNVQDPKTEEATAKHYQKGLLQLSENALFDTPKSRRDHTSVILAIHPSHVDLIRERIKQCRREILALVENSNLPKSEVYALQFSAFPLTKTNKEEAKTKEN